MATRYRNQRKKVHHPPSINQTTSRMVKYQYRLVHNQERAIWIRSYSMMKESNEETEGTRANRRLEAVVNGDAPRD